jgi:MOSC domain-containing protein YiiM
VRTVVVSIHTAKGRRLPMRCVPAVEAEAGVGLVGDRYHGSRHRHVTIQSASSLAEAAERLGAPVEAGLTRRNITVAEGRLPTRPGTPLRIGDIRLEVVRVAAPCGILDDEIAPGAARALHDRAGTVFRLLGSGTITVGDLVQWDD